MSLSQIHKVFWKITEHFTFYVPMAKRMFWYGVDERGRQKPRKSVYAGSVGIIGRMLSCKQLMDGGMYASP